MSRLIRSSIFPSNSSYLVFRFERSLRKYEQKPIKKVKCNQICSHCIIHHIRKQPLSPAHGPTFRNRISGNQNTVERKQKAQKSEDRHLISSNKSIRLSKPRQLEELSNNRNNLQMKIYASLANISMDKGSKVGSKNQSSDKKSQLEEQVYLNDFQPSEAMEEQKQDQDEEEFKRIQIGEKSENSMKQEQEERIEEVKEEENIMIAHNNEQQCLSAGFERLSVAELPQIPSHQVNSEEKEDYPEQNQEIEQNCQEFVIEPEPFIEPQHQEQIQSRGNIRQRPCSDSVYSNIIEEDNLSQKMMDKCLAFQGGRIYIDSQGQNFYISVRVFNKLRRQSSSLDDLLTTLINQRPYLASSREQLKTELFNYLHSE